MNKIIENKPDIVLLDIMMPQISGYDVCKIIKQNEALRQEHNELQQKVQERTEELMKAKISGLKDRLNLK